MFKASRIRLLGIAAGAAIALMIGAWSTPAHGVDDQAMTIDINWPAGRW